MHDLALHCKDKQNDPVAQQYRPKDRNVKHGKEGHDKCYTEGPCDGVPGTTKQCSLPFHLATNHCIY